MSKPLERLDLIQEDLDSVYSNNYQLPFLVHDLIHTDLPWLIEYVEKVENFLKLAEGYEGQQINYMTGYMSSLRDLRKELDEITT